MLDKLKFNNLVITNKKLIQQARAQAIAKLVQKLRKLKNALEKQPDNEKHKERLRKNVECMAQMKSLKPLHIMRSMLVQSAQKHGAVLTNGRATPDEIAIAMLGLNKVMEGVIAKFQQELKLSSEADASWRQEILETSKRRLKIDRTEDRRLKRKGLKEQKAQSRKRLEWLEQNKPGGQELDSSTTAIATAAGVCKVEVIEAPEPEKKETKIKKQDKPKRTPKVIKTGKLPEIPQSSSKPEENKPMPNIKREQDQSKLNKKQNKPKTLEKEKPTRVIEPSTQNKPKPAEKERPTRVIEPSKQSKPKKEEKERPTHVIDPFFITDSGQPYLSTAVVLSDDSENESDNDESQLAQRSRKPIANRREFRESNRREFGGNNRRDFGETNRREFGENNRREFSETNRKEFSSNQSDNRHPSWIAKEKKKPVITNFKGKKIKFSDDGTSAETILPILPKLVAPAEDSQTDMHPSWVAKQKLKPKIATFTGTKIKFDD